MELDDQDYRKKHTMRWDAVRQFANNDCYTLFLSPPRTLPLSAEFNDTKNDIEQILWRY